MPKGFELEQDQGSEIPFVSESTSSGKQISKKELGRLRSKQALAQLQASAEGTTEISESGGDEIKEPQTKKMKPDIRDHDMVMAS